MHSRLFVMLLLLLALPAGAAVTVVSTSPANGARGVDPGLAQFSVRFSEPVGPAYSFVLSDAGAPLPATGNPLFSEKNTVCTVPVKLAPSTTYAVWINSARFNNFRSAKDGTPVTPYQVTFTTASAAGPQPSALVVVSTFPKHGAKGVKPGKSEIRIRFSAPVRPDGYSFVISDQGRFPTLVGKPRFEEGNTVCVQQVTLQPGVTYALSINSERFNSFRSLADPTVAVRPYLLKFTTAGKRLGAAPPASGPTRLAFASRHGPPMQVTVCVDPRVELLGIVFRLAGNPEYSQDRLPAYTEDIRRHFTRFAGHPLIQLAKQLQREQGVSYNAPMSLAPYLGDARDLQPRVPLEPPPPGLDPRWPGSEPPRFLELARAFVREADFARFIREHQPLYDQTTGELAQVLREAGHLEWLADFFGSRPGARLLVVVGLGNGGHCYGASARTPQGEELYCILGAWQPDERGVPCFDEAIVPTVVHEFVHSYTNPLVDSHQAALEQVGQRSFAPVERQMAEQAYGEWKIMLYETMVRACVGRYLLACQSAPAAERLLQECESLGFRLVRPLYTLLAEYESNRDRYPTLEAFMPRIIARLQQAG